MSGLGTRKAGARCDRPNASVSTGQRGSSLPVLAVADFFNQTLELKGDTFLCRGGAMARAPRGSGAYGGGRTQAVAARAYTSPHSRPAGDGLVRRQAIFGLPRIRDPSQPGIQSRREGRLSPQQDRLQPAGTEFATLAQQRRAVPKISLVGCRYQRRGSRQDIQIHDHAGPRHRHRCRSNRGKERRNIRYVRIDILRRTSIRYLIGDS
jgi:hypothetical protein